MHSKGRCKWSDHLLWPDRSSLSANSDNSFDADVSNAILPRLRHRIQAGLKMLGGDLLFATREEAVDRHLFVLAAMSASHDYTDAKVLQNWLSDVIGHLETLPEPIQIALGLALFKSAMSIFTGAPIKSRIGTKSDVVRCGNNCLSYNANDGGLLSARCHRGSARPKRIRIGGDLGIVNGERSVCNANIAMVEASRSPP